jgi:antitoxin YefM
LYVRTYFCGREAVVSIRFSEDIRPLSEFRANAAAFVEQVQSTRRPIVLTQRGRGAAVLLDVNEYERLVERAEVLEDIRVAEEQIARGEGVEHEAARELVLARLRR